MTDRKQCPEGLFLSETGVAEPGWVTEYRCELEAGHEEDWHKDVEMQWKTY